MNVSSTRCLVHALALAIVFGCVPERLFAQAAAGSGGRALRPWRPVIGVGGAWLGAQDLGRVTAQTRRAAVGVTAPQLFTLFTTETNLGGAPAAALSVTVPITRQWAVVVRGGAARPTLTTTITGDAEGAPATEATEQTADYTVEASVAYQLPRLGGRHARAYLLAGGGYLRQLHEANVLVETGHSWHTGAGLRWWLRGGDGRARALGLTGELRWVWQSGGIAYTTATRSIPAAAAGFFVSF